ncbi:efflux RND transporter permease subunit [Marinomonas ostreistagni]|uniref:efflux RND transporter permease subunit n=1 Tax=Marinomonas ostreistagni TaxID=359209 RepID=UPI00194FB89C|nr:efflux RND transporter permease subunit [Marinomonas ostreistagni]MBM6549622.1 efflux RND transporter permease subunit [Marinomonas ostreistagni]
MNSEQARGIIPWFANNPVAANLLLVLVIALGIMSVGDLNREAFPSFPADRVSISVDYDSGSAQASEEGVAIPIEQALQDVLGIDDLTTQSTANGASATIEMQEGYDIEKLMQDVKDKLDQVTSFPDEADPPVVSRSRREEHALWIQLYGDADRRTLQTLAEELESDLLTSAYINAVSISGWLDPTMLIEVDKTKLEAYNLTLSDIANAINEESTPSRVATVRDADVYLHVRASEQAYVKQQFADIRIVSLASGGSLRLGDLAIIRDAYDEDDFVLSRFNGESSLALEVITTGEDDITASVNGARDIIQQWLDSNRLPQGVSLDTWHDRSESINDRLALMVKNAITGILLVFVMLAVFLNLTVAFWVALGLPFIFFGTFYVMGLESVGLTLNLLTTFGFIMALGIVVDDAVVIGESVYSVRQKEGDTLANTIKGTMQVAVPTLFGVFTTVAAFWALSNIEGRLGQLYAQFAAVVTICLLLSVIESKLILPAHLAHLNTQKRRAENPLLKLWSKVQQTADGALQWFNHKIYYGLIHRAIDHRYAVIVLFAAVFTLVASMPFTGAIRISFFPDIPGDTIRANLTMHNDASYGQTHKVLTHLEQSALATDRQLRGEQEQAGIENLQVTASNDQSGSLRIELGSQANYSAAEFARTWQTLIGEPEGVSNLRIRTSWGSVDALRVELRGSDNSVLDAAMATLIKKLDAVPAVQGIEENDSAKESRIVLNLNDQGRSLGLTTNELASQIMSNFDGQVVQKYQRDNSEVEVRLGYPDAQQESPANILNTLIILENGARVPLASVAYLTQEVAQTKITRIDSKRSVYLSAEVDKERMSATEVVAYLKNAVEPEMKQRFPAVDMYYSGEAEEREETESSMVEMFAIAMLIIYGLLAIPLKSYSQPIVIMMAIPFGVVGALLGHWFNDLALGIFSLNGIIALSGVVVNDSLLLTSRFNELRKQTVHLRKAVVEACQSRLRAVLLTSVTTYAGLIPILGETSRQAKVMVPAAVSLAYGILFATLITLVLIPVLLMIKEDLHNLYSRLKGKVSGQTVEQAP